MRHSFYTLSIAFLFLFLLFLPAAHVVAQTNVLMQHNDLLRTGFNYNETILNQSNVNKNTFGKLFFKPVDDQIYAQPLVISNLNIAGGKHNVVYVATVNNSVYAFDADDYRVPTFWEKSLTPSGQRVVKASDMTGACLGFYADFSGNIGIVSTPAIDSAAGTIYVVSRSVSTTSPATFVQYLHALDMRTGAERPNSPVAITASVKGNGDGNVNGNIIFDPQKQNQRAGLLLYKGVVYIEWASHCDWGPYHGWVMGYDATTLQQKYVYNSTPNGTFGGIWMSGQAPAVDNQGNIYLTTGNGSVGVNGNPNDTINRGESLLKLTTKPGYLKLADYFTPNNYQYLEENDLDYGSDGVMLIPNTSLSLSGSKNSYLYLVNTTNLGKETSNNAGALQTLDINAEFVGDNHLHGSPVYFQNTNRKEYIYVWAEGGLLKQIPFIRKKKRLDTANTIFGTTILPQGMPGGMLSVSSNKLKANTGIVWAVHPLSGNANGRTVPGELHAFAANDVSHELWNSQQNAQRDSSEYFGKFVCPTVANGKVYLATFSNKLMVYGLLPVNKTTTADKTVAEKAEPILPTTNATIEVYPNPANSQTTVTFESSSKEAQKSLLLLLTSAGKAVYKQSISVIPGNNTFTLSIPANVKSGIYLVQLITADGNTALKKLVVEKTK